MKLRERSSPQGVIDQWLQLVEAEFGSGGHVASLRRMSSTVQKVLESPAQAPSHLVDLGYAIGVDNRDLTFALRSLELLAQAGGQATAAALNTRSAAVLVADGWNAGVLNRTQTISSTLTPLPFFVQLLQQHYTRADDFALPANQRVVLVIVDVQHVVGNRLELARVQRTVIDHLRAVFSAGQPVSEGPNGNLVVMVERSSTLLDDVAAVGRVLAADPSVKVHALRVWIEPLSDDEIHLESHLESLLGKVG